MDNGYLEICGLLVLHIHAARTQISYLSDGVDTNMSKNIK